MAITPLPDPPSRSDPANFPERADAFMAALPGFATEVNALAQQVDEATETAGEYKDSAGASATAANGSATNALLSETHAQGSAATAAQARADAENARDLAKDWSSKASGTVGGTPFLSAKQYAELAAQGAGLPMYAFSAIPLDDSGPIYVLGVGVMEWNSTLSLYLPLVRHRECYFEQGSSQDMIRLSRDYNGRLLTIGQQTVEIPADGVEVSVGTPMTAISYAYAKIDSGVLGLDIGTGAGWGHATDPVTGDEVRYDGTTYDRSRLLVGMFCSGNASHVVNDDSTNANIASWHNRRRRRMGIGSGSINVVSTSPATLTGPNLVGLIWAGSLYRAWAYGVGRSSVATGAIGFQMSGTGVSSSIQSVVTSSTANAQESFSQERSFRALSDLRTAAQLQGNTSAGATATISAEIWMEFEG